MSDSFQKLFDLTGRVAIVTGASKGIGEAIARGLAAFGAAVVVSSRKQASVETVAASIREAGGSAAAVPAHMGDPDAVRSLLARTSDLFGRLDIVVNNAAVNPIYGPLLEAPDDAFVKIMNVNVQGPLELAQRADPLLVRGGGGSIINIGSVGGIRPEPMLGLYSASKAALISLTKAMALEWAPDAVRANVICPGLVQTRFSAALWQDPAVLKRFLEHVPLGRIAQPEEIVGLAIHLASPAGRYCTGAVFTVDGGHTI